MRIITSSSFATAALLATVALPACAQPAPAPTAAPTAAATQDADPALWVVKDKDTTIYLFGTVHVLKPGLSWFDEGVKKAFDGSKELVLEMVEPDPATLQGIVMSKAIAGPNDPPLTPQLPEARRAEYTKAITAAGLPAAAADKLKPWYASVVVSMAMIQKAGYQADSGAEKMLSAAAKTQGKTVSGLETAEQQLGFFAGMSNEAQLKFLNSTLEELPKGAKMLDTMVANWAKGDPDALAATMNEGLKDTPEVAKTILYDRNANWATWISKRMQQPGTVFVAVGAGHLAGADSVQAKLMPYKLKAVRVQY